MTKLYSDTGNVLASLAKAASNYDAGTLRVYDTDQVPLVAVTEATVEERNLFGTAIHRVNGRVCSIEFRSTDLGTTMLDLSFHESVVDSQLTFMPAGPSAVDARQATAPTDLGDRLVEALGTLEDEGAFWTFKGVGSASMANMGHYTDFEYEYSIDGLEV